MFQIIGTYSETLGSQIIRNVLEEPISHIAFVFDDKLVFHSNIKGVNALWAGDFLKHNRVFCYKNFDLSLNDEEQLYQTLIQFDNKEYDKMAFAYFAYAALKRKFFDIPLPEKNPYNDKDKYLCTELASVLPDFVFYKKENPFKNKQLSIITPYQLMKEI